MNAQLFGAIVRPTIIERDADASCPPKVSDEGPSNLPHSDDLGIRAQPQSKKGPHFRDKNVTNRKTSRRTRCS